MKQLCLSAIAIFVVCAFGPRELIGHEALTTTVQFDREIVRVLNRRCVMCHSEHGPSFSLETYEQTWRARRPIRSAVLPRHMPPWAAVPGYGEFVNSNDLTLRETQFVVSWVEGLGPRNAGTVFRNIVALDAEPPPAVRAKSPVAGWPSGEPDLTRPLSANTIEPGQPDRVERVVVDLGLTEERRVRGVDYLPGDRRVVRAASFSVEETGQWLGSWTPWHGVSAPPPGVAYRLPAGSHVVAELYYRSADELVIDSGALGLFFADESSPKEPSDVVLKTQGVVAARAGSHRFRAETRLTTDTAALAVWPELRPGMTSIEVSARRPDGSTEILLFAVDPILDWPTPYVFKEPIRLPRDTELSVTTYYAGDAARGRTGGIRLTVSTYDE